MRSRASWTYVCVGASEAIEAADPNDAALTYEHTHTHTQLHHTTRKHAGWVLTLPRCLVSSVCVCQSWLLSALAYVSWPVGVHGWGGGRQRHHATPHHHTAHPHGTGQPSPRPCEWQACCPLAPPRPGCPYPPQQQQADRPAQPVEQQQRHARPLRYTHKTTHHILETADRRQPRGVAGAEPLCLVLCV